MEPVLRKSLAVLAAPRDALAQKMIPNVFVLDVLIEYARYRPVGAEADGRNGRGYRASCRGVCRGLLSN